MELLGPEALRTGHFSDFDVVVLGIRAYETRPDLVAANDRLLDYVRDGGTLIVQYNKYEFMLRSVQAAHATIRFGPHTEIQHGIVGFFPRCQEF